MKNILIVYFTGTGGTELVVKSIETNLINKGESVELFPLDLSKVKSISDANDKINSIDRVVVAYPVYSYCAPLPVQRWIQGLPRANGTKASVISISAGGEAKSNGTCRKHCIGALEEKGFSVDYERMITMPSNYAGTAGEEINVMLVKAVPVISKIVADDIAEEVVMREKPKKSFVFEYIAKIFGGYAEKFGRMLRTSEDCTNCKWCENNCPTNNIKIEDGQISAASNCTLCLRCVYGCPANAIYSKTYNYSIIKNGYDIKAMNEKASTIKNTDVSHIKGGRLWKGAENYLNEVFG